MGKAQITIFIILGLVILLAVVFVVFFKKEPAQQKEPSDAKPVEDFVLSCMQQVGKEGLDILGLQSGYIYLPQIIERNPTAHVRLDRQGVLKLPMWYYEGEDRTPSLEFMERELAIYIKQNLPSCTNKFTAFQDWTVVERSDIFPVVEIADEVVVNVKWLLEARKNERVVPLNEFSHSFQVGLKEIWNLADKTMKRENEIGWFENLTIDLMSINPDIPLSGMEFKCGTKRWRLNEVKDNLQTMLMYNLPFVRVHNTDFPAPLESLKTYEKLRDEAEDIRAALEQGEEPDWPENVPADVFEVNRMRFDVGIPPTDLKAAFVYRPEWNMLVNAQPSSGGTLSSNQMKGPRKYLKFLCINQWHFAYDIIYPVQMLIRDDKAFNNEGFIFQFAFPVIVEDNAESRLFFGSRRFVQPDIGADFCTTFGEQQADIVALGFPEGSAVAEQLEDANVSYRCVNQECKLGKTTSDGTGAIHLSTYLPQGCSNPTIIAQKEGYLTAEKTAGENTEILLTRLKKLNYSFVVHPYYEEVSKTNPFVADNKQWLEPYTGLKNLKATIIINARDRDFEQNLQETGVLVLIADDINYDIDILLYQGDRPVGGYRAENLTIKYEEAAYSDSIVFHVVEYRPSPAQSYEQAGLFAFLYERGEHNDQPYEKYLRPTFT